MNETVQCNNKVVGGKENSKNPRTPVSRHIGMKVFTGERNYTLQILSNKLI